ncbi:hypothetical protein SD77_1640 [Bacillus badius]|uniref:Uncharacterized protein n=1 Tax=Bacillus badius TaxID=1455 RepID=A0ABR5ASN9_BACBA|nr:hypothetical protein SD77_1640 [Bacillus badius]
MASIAYKLEPSRLDEKFQQKTDFFEGSYKKEGALYWSFLSVFSE